MGDWYGQLACRGLQADFGQHEDIALLVEFIRQIDLTLNEADLLLYLAGQSRADRPELAQICYETARQVYQTQAPGLPAAFFERVMGQSAGLGQLVPPDNYQAFARLEHDYQLWLDRIASASFCHEAAWQQLDRYYQQQPGLVAD